MKRTLLSCMTVCLMATSSIMAQTTTSSSETNTANEKTRFGVKLGGQITGIDEIHSGSGKRIGPVAGVLMQIPLQKKSNCQLFFTPELLISHAGEKGNARENGKLKEDVKFYQDYFELPLLFKGYLMKSKLLYIEVGPKLDYMFYQKNKDLDLDDPNKFDFGLCLGGGLNLGSKNNFEIGARLNYGLLDMYPDVKKKNYNMGGAVTLAYLFGGNDTEKEVVSQETIVENNEKVNDMKQEVKAQEPKPEPKPTPRPEPVVAKPEFTPEAVYFDLNKSNVKTTESSKIDAAAKFLKENPDYKVRLVGYADRQTGSASYNLKISKRRVDAVRDYMINKGNIAASRITADYEGDKVQPEASNDKNRCVTIYVTE